MAKADPFNTFSIRLPQSLVDQLEARTLVTKRSRNKEIHFLLAHAIDVDVQKDIELGLEMKERNHPSGR